MKRSLILTILFLLCAQLGFAAGTTGKIAGRIRDAKTGEALPAANIVVVGTNYGAASDLQGYYVILNLPPGTYTVRATIIGYQTAVYQNVRVEIDQTTDLDIRLNEQVIGTDEVIIVATRPIVQKDISASRANITSAEVNNLPVTSVATVVGLQAGVVGGEIRGGTADQTAYLLNGLTLKDERTNTSFSPISLLAVQDIQIQTGGFNAEYGNARSGVVNVVTREGARNKYNVGSILRYRPPGRKYFGMAPNEYDTYFVRPYLDPAVAFTGTTSRDINGNPIWDLWTQNQYVQFVGWNEISRRLLTDNDPSNDLTPEAAQELWRWQHRKIFDTGVPDFTGDFSLGGPVPLLSESLGDLRFFATYRLSQTAYAIPLALDRMSDWSANVKVTSDLDPSMKLMVEYLDSFSENVSASRSGAFSNFVSTFGVASENSNGSFRDARMFSTDYWAPSTVRRSLYGAKFTHVLTPTAFYEVIAQLTDSKYETKARVLRDTTRRYLFGNSYYADEGPYGAASYGPSWTLNGVDGMLMVFTMPYDRSSLTTLNLRADYVSQLNAFNQLKTGVEFTHTTNKVDYGSTDDRLPDGNNEYKWTSTPIRFAAYAQNKLEYEGMVANVGLRFEMSHAGGEWFRIDYPWDPALRATNADAIDTLLPKEPTNYVTALSPRLGVAFPISENAKLFFNYGHFRSMPSPTDLYLIEREVATRQIVYLADPNAELPRTVSYELGYEHNLFDQLLMRVAAFYKDVTNERFSVSYQSRDGQVSYTTSTTNRYRDIRGFEFTLSKNRGNWVQGFINYTYQVTSFGYFGRPSYNENPVTQRDNERENTIITRPVPQPYARLNLDFFTPMNFGPSLFGEEGFYPLGDVRLNFLGAWSAGSFITWVGGGSVPGVSNNLQFRDNWSFDVRASKSFAMMGASIQFFVDIFNVFNIKSFSTTGFIDGGDSRAYYGSLHLPEEEFLKYGNIPGDDRAGDYRKPGVEYQPMIRRNDVTQLTNPAQIDRRAWYYDLKTRGFYYYDFNAGQWTPVPQERLQAALDNKAYIDMPNLNYWTFLNPRNWFFGVRISFDIQ